MGCALEWRSQPRVSDSVILGSDGKRLHALEASETVGHCSLCHVCFRCDDITSVRDTRMNMQLGGHAGQRRPTSELDAFVPEDVELTNFDVDRRQIGSVAYASRGYIG
jgi:hypothetical protein